MPLNQPALKHYSEFRELLENYQMSGRASDAVKDMKLVLLIAPFSTGRNTLITELLRSKPNEYYFIVSDTTRPPQVRDGKLEQNGVNYFFRTEEEMLADIKNGEFFEAELIHTQQVSGISIRELEKAKQLQKIAITDIDVGGVHNALRSKPDTVVVFLLPPSFEEWQDRIATRGKMSDQEFRNRLQGADKVFTEGLSNTTYKYVIAEDIKQSVEIINDIAHGKQSPHQGRAVGLIHQLQGNLHQKLSSLSF